MNETAAKRDARHAMEILPVEDRNWFIQPMSWEESTRAVLAGTPFKHSVVGVFPTAEIAERIVRDHNAALAAPMAADMSHDLVRALEAAAKIVEGEPYQKRYRTWPWWGIGNRDHEDQIVQFADAAAKTIRALANPARSTSSEDALWASVSPLDNWHEDLGDVLWWCWRDGKWLGEAPYVGSPLDLGHTVECNTHAQNGDTPAARFMVGGWPGYHTHWSPIPLPASPHTQKSSAPIEGDRS